MAQESTASCLAHAQPSGCEKTSFDVEAFADVVARRVVQLLRDEAPSQSGLVDAATVARTLGVSRTTVYEHATELGARQVGSGSRPRLRFDVDEAREAWTRRSASERSQASETPVVTEIRRRRKRTGLGSNARLLPIRGSKAAS